MGLFKENLNEGNKNVGIAWGNTTTHARAFVSTSVAVQLKRLPNVSHLHIGIKPLHYPFCMWDISVEGLNICSTYKGPCV